MEKNIYKKNSVLSTTKSQQEHWSAQRHNKRNLKDLINPKETWYELASDRTHWSAAFYGKSVVIARNGLAKEVEAIDKLNLHCLNLRSL